MEDVGLSHEVKTENPQPADALKDPHNPLNAGVPEAENHPPTEDKQHEEEQGKMGQLVIVGALALSLSSALVTQTCMPEMMEQYRLDERLRTFYNPKQVEKMIASMFIIAESMAGIVAPILSSQLVDNYNYWTAFVALMGILGAWSLIYFAACEHVKTCSAAAVLSEEEGQQLIN